MENTYVANLLRDSRKQQGDNLANYIYADYTDTVPFSWFLTNILGRELKDETFDFKALSAHVVNLYALFLMIDKLGGAVNKDVVKLILRIEDFNAKKTSEKGISLVQSMLDLMVTQFLGNTLTSKPTDLQTKKKVVFDKDDKGKDYSDKYFSFAYNGTRYVVRTDTFDLTNVLEHL